MFFWSADSFSSMLHGVVWPRGQEEAFSKTLMYFKELWEAKYLRFQLTGIWLGLSGRFARVPGLNGVTKAFELSNALGVTNKVTQHGLEFPSSTYTSSYTHQNPYMDQSWSLVLFALIKKYLCIHHFVFFFRSAIQIERKISNRSWRSGICAKCVCGNDQ